MTPIETFFGSDQTLLLLSTMFVVTLMAGIMLNVRSKQRQLDYDLELKKENMEFERQKYLHESELQMRRLELEFPESNQGKAKPLDDQQETNKYLYIEISDGAKATFSDMLKGFEEYARLLGYEVSLSIDTAKRGQVGFNFSLSGEGQFRSQSQMKSDIEEYMAAMTNKEKRFVAPRNSVAPYNQPQSIPMQKLKSTKRQVNDLQNQDSLYRDLYQSLMTFLNGSSTNIYINQQLIGNKMGNDLRSYSADGASNVIQGDNSGNHITDSNIQIGKNVNQKNEQAQALLDVIAALKAENNTELAPAIRQFENAHEEVTEEEKPDPSRLERFFTKGSETIKQVGVLADTTSKVNKALELFSAIPIG